MAADSPVTAFAEALVGVVDKQVVSEGGYLKVDRGQVVIFGSKPAKDYGSGALRKIWEAKGAVDGGGMFPKGVAIGVLDSGYSWYEFVSGTALVIGCDKDGNVFVATPSDDGASNGVQIQIGRVRKYVSGANPGELKEYSRMIGAGQGGGVDIIVEKTGGGSELLRLALQPRNDGDTTLQFQLEAPPVLSGVRK
jgi:hypothetical protein